MALLEETHIMEGILKDIMEGILKALNFYPPIR